MSTHESPCVICARDAEHGYLCDDHFTRLASMLRQIEDESAILDARPSMAIQVGAGGGSTLASHRAPANLNAIVASDPRRGTGRIAYDDADPWGIDNTASVLETLHSRARTVREEREITDNGGMVTISGERDFLSRSLEWCARQPWIDEFYTEIRELLGQLQRTNHTQEARPEGICYLPRFESLCGGRIWRREQKRLLWRTKPDRCDREQVEVADGLAYCDRCGATWDGKALDRLRLIEEQRKAEAARPKTEDGRRMLTADEVASRYKVKRSTVFVWAHRLGVMSVNGHYDPEWFAEKMAG